MALGLVYSQKRHPAALPTVLRLAEERLAVDGLRGTREIPLRSVRSARLTYEERGLGARGCKTTLTLEDGKRLSFTSTTWRGLVEVRPQPAEYNAFVAGLLPAIARANPRAVFLAGKPAWLWGLTVAAGAVVVAAAIVAGWWGYRDGSREVALLGAATLVVAAWQMEPMVRRNRPRRFAPDSPPADLLA
ncbi:MAG TPA: hypothetical protein VIL65_01005 [Beijerinckiaceae bacterium]|jgi:hypothetical protein